MNRNGVLRCLSLPPFGVFALSFSFCFRCFFAVRSSPCFSLLLRCPVLPSLLQFFFLLSFVASSAHFILLFGCLLLASVAVYLSLRLVALCVCASFPLLLALFCCLCSGVLDVGLFAFASTRGLHRGPVVDVVVLGFSPLGCEVLLFGYQVFLS